MICKITKVSNSKSKIVQTFLLASSIFVLSACGNALMYGEGTNFSLATVHLNDDPATPIRIVSGLDRTVAALAPRKAQGKEVVNMVSDFDLKHPGSNPFTDTLSINTEFASGEAALKAAEKPDVAAKIMNFNFVSVASPSELQRKLNAQRYVRQNGTSPEALKEIATRMKVLGHTADPADDISDAIVRADSETFNQYSDIIYEVTGKAF